MKWADLGQHILQMNPQQLNCEVAVLIDGEMFSGLNANMILKHDRPEIDYLEPYLDLEVKGMEGRLT